jgi:hypothetical protein
MPEVITHLVSKNCAEKWLAHLFMNPDRQQARASLVVGDLEFRVVGSPSGSAAGYR